jgi:hypothetical protein
MGLVEWHFVDPCPPELLEIPGRGRQAALDPRAVALLHRVDLARQLEVDVGHEGILQSGASGCATASGGDPGLALQSRNSIFDCHRVVVTRIERPPASQPQGTAAPSALAVACACQDPMRLVDDAAEGPHARRLRN